MGDISSFHVEDDSLIVTLTSSSHPQKVIGQISPFVPESLQEFRGIPYGTVPGRWRHSALNNSLPTDEYLATKNGPQCPQPSMFANSDTYQSHLDWPTDVGESEFDCLNLFIVRPSPAALKKAGFDPSNSKLPVYINIHGGGFGFGAGTDPMWDPSRLVSRSLASGKPIIAVNNNYRLGIFGFGISSDVIALQTSETELKGGNFGLGDQRIAIRWVAKNIPDFGGDPSKITIAGQSAGGMSVNAHILEAKFGTQPPLFRRVIQQSGAFGTLGPLPLAKLDKKWQSLYKSLEITEKSQLERMKVLSALSTSELLAAAVKLGWITFPLVIDDTTIRNRPNGRVSVHLGQLEGTISENQMAQKEAIGLYVGDCEDEGFFSFQIANIKSFAHMEELFSSVPAAALKDICAAYKITPETPISDFRYRLSKVMTDLQFGFTVDDAYEEMSSTAADQTRPTDGSPAFPTTARRYRVKFGNPFPGINHNVAHHCVDLLYIYDCFYVDMVKTDELEESTKTRPEGWASNDSLVKTVQGHWIDFIVDDIIPGQEDLATVYEVDRKVYYKDIYKDEDWLEFKGRLETVRKNLPAVVLMRDALQKLPSPFKL